MKDGGILPDDDEGDTIRREMARERTRQPRTVEALLASQQAEIEKLQRDLQRAQSDLTLSQQQVNTQGAQLHREGVQAKVKALQGLIPPAVLLRAEHIMLADSPSADDSSLNLSITIPGDKDGEGAETRKFESPTEIVEYLLSAMPSGQAPVVPNNLLELAQRKPEKPDPPDPKAEADKIDEFLQSGPEAVEVGA